MIYCIQKNKVHIKRTARKGKKIMYLRTKLQPRAHDNLNKIGDQKYPGMRVTKGYITQNLLMSYQSFIGDSEKVRKAIAESDLKEEGGGIAVNLNIKYEANEKLQELKKILDKETGRSFFPAQVLDILLICALDSDGCTEQVRDIPDKDLAKALLDVAYKILTEETLSINVMNAKTGLINTLDENHLL